MPYKGNILFIKSKLITFFKGALLLTLIIISIGLLIPGNTIIPVSGGTRSDWDSTSFWYYPWGPSGVHKGIDIFKEQSTPVIAPVSGMIIQKGYGTIAGNYIYLLGPKWRIHYFAHMDTILVGRHSMVKQGQLIGMVGNSGNAEGKDPHLLATYLQPLS